MNKDEMQAELDELRAQIAVLMEARAERSDDEPDVESGGSGGDAPQRVRELLSKFEAELDELPTLSSLGVFAMGVLLGRFLR